MDAIWNELVKAVIPWIGPGVSAGMAFLIAWLGTQKHLRTVAKNAAVEAEKQIGPGHGADKKKKANELVATTLNKKPWKRKLAAVTMTNMETMIEEHGMKEITRRASLVPKPITETDDTE